MTQRVYNFNPGPATLPPEAIAKTAEDLVDFRRTGIGLMEVSHRSPEFIAVIEETEALLRELLGIPENYHVLFLQGGASSQFFMVPMNLLGDGGTATYLDTGTWAAKAIVEAGKFAPVEVPFSSLPDNYNRVPDPHEYQVDENSEYLYFVSNNTIFGTQFQTMPQSEKTLVSDMSSDILSRPLEVAEFGIIFAGAQKNLGPAGVTIVIIRDDLLDRCPEQVPTMLQYRTHAAKKSMFNTPPCVAVYVVGQVLKWTAAQGGIPEMERRNRAKAKLLYDCIDGSSYYRGHAAPRSRSLMNVSFNLPSPELEATFIAAADRAGLKGLKGHRSIGGCRASIYNAFPVEGVERLVAFMERFALDHPA